MHSLGALGALLHASFLVLLVQGIHKTRDNAYKRSLHRFPAMDRTTGFHLPIYMVHLYRNFRSNLSRPMDTMEQTAVKQADTVKSVMAKSKTRFYLLIWLGFWKLNWTGIHLNSRMYTNSWILLHLSQYRDHIYNISCNYKQLNPVVFIFFILGKKKFEFLLQPFFLELFQSFRWKLFLTITHLEIRHET